MYVILVKRECNRELRVDFYWIDIISSIGKKATSRLRGRQKCTRIELHSHTQRYQINDSGKYQFIIKVSSFKNCSSFSRLKLSCCLLDGHNDTFEKIIQMFSKLK